MKIFGSLKNAFLGILTELSAASLLFLLAYLASILIISIGKR